MAKRFVLWMLLLLLTAVNIYIAIHRKKGYEYIKQSAYADLYPNISKGIRNISAEKNNELTVDLKGYGNANWEVRCNDSIIASGLSNPLKFVIKEKVYRYTLTPQNNQPPVVFIIDYSPAEVYKNFSSSMGTNYEIRYCSVPFLNNDNSSVSKWKDDLHYTNTAELAAVKKEISDSLHITDGMTTVKKLETISAYIYSRVGKSFLVPADSLEKYSPYQQFCLARNGTAKLWCGNAADIFNLYTSAAGITCRRVAIDGKKDLFQLGEHIVNECYVPETGEWVMTDLKQNILLLKDSTGKLFNTAELYQLKKLGQTGSLIQLSMGDSSLAETTYSDIENKYIWKENSLSYLYPYNPLTVHSFVNRVKRYSGLFPWQEVYDENQQYSNFRFYVKTLLLYGWLLVALRILYLYLFSKKPTT